ncbi:hypothetical protein TNCV_4706291 [Trichonephila clavipes]|nr:hypothetical protein TNCV_4706291 [Trichonephila clavipes]
MPLDNKCRIDRWPVRLQTRAVVISTETESGFITEDDTSPVCHTPSCPRVGKKSSRHMMWGQCGHSINDPVCVPGNPPRRYTLSVIHCCQHRATTISLRPRWRPFYSTNLLLWRPLYGPYQSPSAARTAAGYVFPKSQYRLSKSSDLAVRRSYSCF